MNYPLTQISAHYKYFRLHSGVNSSMMVRQVILLAAIFLLAFGLNIMVFET